MHIASSFGSKGILEALLQHGAMINKQNKVSVYIMAVDSLMSPTPSVNKRFILTPPSRLFKAVKLFPWKM